MSELFQVMAKVCTKLLQAFLICASLLGVAVLLLRMRTNKTLNSLKITGHGLQLHSYRSISATEINSYLTNWTSAANAPISKSPSPPANTSYTPLTALDIQNVEKFVFFTGYPRSGHSIVGSLIDAHPNIILSYGFFLFKRLAAKAPVDSLFKNRTALFREIHRRSYEYSKVSAGKDGKGYTLDVPGAWSGTFDHLKVIGDKSAKLTADTYLHDPKRFKHLYSKLKSVAGVPLYAIHVVRNPFDMIATQALYTQGMTSTGHRVKAKYSEENKMDKPGLLDKVTKQYFKWARAVSKMVPLCNMTLLEIHNEDLVKDTRATLLKICKFLEVECHKDYLDACVKKIYSSVSQTRNFVQWPPDLQESVKDRMKMYPFFERYSFEH